MTHNLYNLTPPSARHYNSTLSIWLSVDPMSDKFWEWLQAVKRTAVQLGL